MVLGPLFGGKKTVCVCREGCEVRSGFPALGNQPEMLLMSRKD